jgi:ADP-ribose pyrophosphatase YjhB (NUDIX family)
MSVGFVGAGLMILYPAEDRWHVLLGLRTRRPFAGFWTIPGGRRHSGEPLWQCAIRETQEEICAHRPLDDVFGDAYAGASTRIGRDEAWSLHIPFVTRWETHALVLARPPVLDRLKCNSEFADVAAFPVDALPNPLHPGVTSALSFFRKRGILPR